MKYEYGIVHYKEFNQESDLQYLESCELHRSGMDNEEATVWLKEWVEMGGRSNTFVKIRRPVGDWELCDSV